MDERPFAGMTALVTGGAQRIGKVIALRLGALGADVAVHYNGSGAQAYAVCSQIQAFGVQAVAVQANLGVEGAAATLVQRASQELGHPIDLLVNNASTFPAVRLAHLDWADLAQTLRVDAWAPLELIRAQHGQLRKRGGAAVNLLDARIADFDLGHAGYFLAKRMLADLTRMAAVEFAPLLRVSGVAPGPILPPPGGGEPDLQRWARHLPLLRTPAPDDVADAVLYLLGARGVTGEVVHVDGGRHLGKAVYGEALEPLPPVPRPGSETGLGPAGKKRPGRSRMGQKRQKRQEGPGGRKGRRVRKARAGAGPGKRGTAPKAKRSPGARRRGKGRAGRGRR